MQIILMLAGDEQRFNEPLTQQIFISFEIKVVVKTAIRKSGLSTREEVCISPLGVPKFRSFLSKLVIR